MTVEVNGDFYGMTSLRRKTSGGPGVKITSVEGTHLMGVVYKPFLNVMLFSKQWNVKHNDYH